MNIVQMRMKTRRLPVRIAEYRSVYPIRSIVTNPINMLIFCSLYSIWFGGYTKSK